MARLGVLFLLAALLVDSAPATGQAICAPVQASFGLAGPAPARLFTDQTFPGPGSPRLVEPVPATVQGYERTVVTACDGWVGQDKFKHAAFSFTITASLYYLAKTSTQMSRGQALLISIGTMTAVGLTKEWVDWNNETKRCFSAGDMLANGVGMLAAAGFVLVF